MLQQITRIIICLNLISNVIDMKKTEITAGLNWNEEFKIEGIKNANEIQQRHHQQRQQQPIECPEEFEDFCLNSGKRPFINTLDLYRLFSENQFGHGERKIKRISNQNTGEFLKNICQCKLGFGLIDLGNDFYPRLVCDWDGTDVRYIPSGLCKKDSCSPFRRCQPKKYRLHVLKRKYSDFEGIEQEMDDSTSLLPESLQNDWTEHFENIVVGCDCVPKKMPEKVENM